MGSLAGSRLAGQKKIKGIDPNLTLRENAEFFARQGENLEEVVSDINDRLKESYEDELQSDILSAVATGSAGGTFAGTTPGKRITDFLTTGFFQTLDLT